MIAVTTRALAHRSSGALAALVLVLATALPAAAEIVSSVDAGQVAAREQTVLGLYLTSVDADRALAADPGIVFIDVRTQAEFQFVGHPEAADANIPFHLLDPAFAHDGGGAYVMVDNPDFVADVQALVARLGKGADAPVFVICRSGSRSAGAVDALAAAGLTNVWNVVDGFEGDKDPDTGHRTVEGWRAEGLPWTYTVPPELAYPQ